jgi:hypothetical protein
MVENGADVDGVVESYLSDGVFAIVPLDLIRGDFVGGVVKYGYNAYFFIYFVHGLVLLELFGADDVWECKTYLSVEIEEMDYPDAHDRSPCSWDTCCASCRTSFCT